MMAAMIAFLDRTLRTLAATTLSAVARIFTGVHPIWTGGRASGKRRIYFANHASHGDFILLSACLPPAERLRTRAVAAADYWGKTRLRRMISEYLLGAVLIDRNCFEHGTNPMKAMLDVLDKGNSLILFPEGTRNVGEERLQRFRSGLYNLAVARPDVELVPCWLENAARVLPKGEFLPVPHLCSVVFGQPVAPKIGEPRSVFLERARSALLDLDPSRMKAAA